MSKSPNEGPFIVSAVLARDRVPSFAKYPFSLPAVRNFSSMQLHPKVTFFVGENGTGKSTLLEAIAVNCDLNAEGGSRNFNFATRETHSTLDRYIKLIKTLAWPKDCYYLRAESLYNLASEIDRLAEDDAGILGGYGGRSLHEQSHGESFFALFDNRLRGRGLYIMDEPEAALSPNRQMQFLNLLHNYCGYGSQFIIATHSPIIMAYPDAWIYEFGLEGIRRIEYEKTEHYQVTRSFLLHTERMLKVLLQNDEEEPRTK